MIMVLDKYPKLDLHGETRDTVYTILKNFINDNIKLKNQVIIVVHGKGMGVLKQEVHQYLKKMKEVKSYHIDIWNEGATIVELNV